MGTIRDLGRVPDSAPLWDCCYRTESGILKERCVLLAVGGWSRLLSRIRLRDFIIQTLIPGMGLRGAFIVPMTFFHGKPRCS
jgi:hypothetical protein